MKKIILTIALIITSLSYSTYGFKPVAEYQYRDYGNHNQNVYHFKKGLKITVNIINEAIQYLHQIPELKDYVAAHLLGTYQQLKNNLDQKPHGAHTPDAQLNQMKRYHIKTMTETLEFLTKELQRKSDLKPYINPKILTRLEYLRSDMELFSRLPLHHKFSSVFHDELELLCATRELLENIRQKTNLKGYHPQHLLDKLPPRQFRPYAH